MTRLARGFCAGLVLTLLTALPPAARANVLFFDDFSGRLRSEWTVRNRAASYYSLQPEYVQLRASSTDLWTNINNAKNLFVIPTPTTGDFIVTIRVRHFVPAAVNFAQLDLVVYDDDDNYIRCNYLHDDFEAGGPHCLEFAREVFGNFSTQLTACDFGEGPFALQIKKVGNVYTQFASLDGVNFFQINGAITYANGNPKYLGFLADADPSESSVAQIDSFEVDDTVNSPPQILGQPQAQIVKTGSTASFSVLPTGSRPFTYQWQKNAVNINGATGQVLNLPNVQKGDPSQLTVKVQNAYGAVTSAPAALYVYDPPPGAPPTPPTLVQTSQSLSASQLKKPRVPTSAQLVSLGANTLINPSKMTIVLTHGWRSNYLSEWPKSMAEALKTALPDNPNIVAWDWRDNAGLNSLDPAPSAACTTSEGRALGRALVDTLGAGYDRPIHFIGHSLGTLVNCTAADYIHGDRRPRNETRPVYSPSNTHMTLLDEAELVNILRGPHVFVTLLTAPYNFNVEAQINDVAQSVANSWAKVLPDRSAWVDNYVSEVGCLHTGAANVCLFRNAPSLNVVVGHGYAYQWYQKTVAAPSQSLMGHGISFERGTLNPAQPAYAEDIYFLQSADSNAPELFVSQIGRPFASSFRNGRCVLFPNLLAYQLLNSVGTAVQGLVATTVNFAGSVATTFVQSFEPPAGIPVLLGTSGSTPAYYTPGPAANQNTGQANWSLQVNMQGSGNRAGRLSAGRAGSADEADPANAVYTLIPVTVPAEATGLTFEYRMTGAADGDYMTMGVGSENNYTMASESVEDGQWNGTPVIQVSAYHGQSVSLVFAMLGANSPPGGALSIRNVQFYVPPKPALSLALSGQQLNLSWPVTATDWTLEMSPSLTDQNAWQPAGAAESDTEYTHAVTLDLGGSTRFFRLRK